MNTIGNKKKKEQKKKMIKLVTVTRRTGWISALVSTTTLASVAFLDIISDRTIFVQNLRTFILQVDFGMPWVREHSTMDKLEGRRCQTTFRPDSLLILLLLSLLILLLLLLLLLLLWFTFVAAKKISNLFSDHAAPLFFQKRFPTQHCAS